MVRKRLIPPDRLTRAALLAFAWIASSAVFAMAQDPCATFIQIPSLPYQYTGDLSTAVNGFEPGPGCATVFDAPGPDMLFTYATGAMAEAIDITVTPTDPALDAVLYMALTCAAVMDPCAAGMDTGADGVAETLMHIALQPAATYFIVVDSNFAGGTFQIDVTPSVDACQSGIPVPAIPFSDLSGSTAGAPNRFVGAGCPGMTFTPVMGDVSYRFTPASSTAVNVRVIPSDPSFNPALYVIEDCMNPALPCPRFADVPMPGSADSLADVQLQAGVPYLFVVDSADSAGPYSFYLDQATDPCVDGMVDVALPLPYTVADTTINGLNQFDPMDGCAAAPFSHAAADRAYRFTPDFDGFVDIAVTPSVTFDPSVYVVRDCADPRTTCDAIAAAAAAGLPVTLQIFVTAGSTCYIVVDSPINEGDFTLSITQGTDPCASAIVVPSIPYSRSGDTSVGASVIDDRSSCTGYGQAGREELYTYTPAADETVTIEIGPMPSFDASLYVFTNCADVPGSCVAGSDKGLAGENEMVQVALTGGVTYYIAVDAYSPTAVGTYEIRMTYGPVLPVTLVAEKDGVSLGVKVSWVGGSQPSYTVVRSPLAKPYNFTTLGTTSQTYYIDVGALTDGLSYAYQVQ